MPHEKRVVAVNIGGVYKTQLDANGHTIIADEPIEVGGKDLGVTPGDLLRASLAACTTITLRMYCNRKNWDVDRIHVEVISDSANGKTTFKRIIEIEGDVDDEQKKRLMQIANACPVHKALTNPIEIESTLKSNE